MKKPIVLKDLIQECICEENGNMPTLTNENDKSNWGAAAAGGLAGFITGFLAGRKPKKQNAKAVAKAALEYQKATQEFKSVLDKFSGVTEEQKKADFIKKLSSMSLDYLKYPAHDISVRNKK